MNDDIDKINEGDRVEFVFENIAPVVGVVLYTPVATGDSYHVRCDNGKLIYVQNYSYAIQEQRRLSKEPTP